MAEYTKQRSGQGLDGYLRIQKEAVWGTDIVDAMSDMKALPESTIDVDNQIIELNNQLATRIKQDPDTLGRIVVAGQLDFEQDPTTLGLLMDLLLDQKAVTGDADTGYDHVYFPTMTGTTGYNSFTVQQAKGGNLADQFSGVVATGFTMSSDNAGVQKISIPVIGRDHTADVARQTSWSFGAVSPYNFGMTTASLTFTSFDATTHAIDSYEFTSEFGYNTEDFKLGSRNIVAPTYNGMITGTIKLTIDADATLLEFARAQTNCAIVLTTTHATDAGAVSGKYIHVIEIPQARLSSASTIGNSNETLKMDLEFTIYGATSTGSGAVEVPYEIRVQDATATYA